MARLTRQRVYIETTFHWFSLIWRFLEIHFQNVTIRKEQLSIIKFNLRSLSANSQMCFSRPSLLHTHIYYCFSSNNWETFECKRFPFKFEFTHSSAFPRKADYSLVKFFKKGFNPNTPVAQKVADETVLRRFQGEGVEFF